MMPVYKQIALYYPEEHAYTFDSYRYGGQAHQSASGAFGMPYSETKHDCTAAKVHSTQKKMPKSSRGILYACIYCLWFLRCRHNMSTDEKQALKRYYALRWWERDGGFAGDVTAAEVQKIKDKYNPRDADLKAFRAAKASGRLDEYWAQNAEKLKMMTGDSTPPTVAA